MASTVKRLVVAGLLGFVIHGTLFGQLPNIQFRAIVLSAVIVLAILCHPAGGKRPGPVARLWDGALLLIGLAGCAYVAVNYWDIMFDQYALRPAGNLLGLGLILVVLELSRRTVGRAFGVLVAIFAAYALWGDALPGRLGHGGVSHETLMSLLYFSTDGLWGQIFDIFASLLVLFILFSSLMMVTGTGERMIRLACYLGGGMRGGAAKIAVIASAFVGSVSGSSVTNVAMTGTLTIPMMKRLGYRPAVAGAIEATASSGGQITPPMMGAGLFLMAEFLGIPVGHMMLVAAFPAALFFLGVLASVHLESLRHGIGALPPDEIPDRDEVQRFDVYAPIFLPITILVAVLAVGYPAAIAILAACTTLAALHLAPARSMRDLRARGRDLLGVFDDAAGPLAMLGTLCAAAGVLIGVIGVVGLGIKFGDTVMSLANDNLFAALLLSGAVIMVIGMGMPTTAAYVLASSVILTAFIKLGVPEISAHMFIFFFATLSAITPPVCAAVFVAAGIAGAPMLPTAVQTMRFAAIKYVLPFLFVLRPEVLLMGEPATVAFAMLKCVVTTLLLSAAFTGYLFAPVPLIGRTVLMLAAVLALGGGWIWLAAALAMTAGVHLMSAIGGHQRKLRSD
ncbi:TRAP transporter permease [Paracoccus sp. (in: a-proteobacteria)]|uniref:TRAP transporter permease n=1 Tax=Paracoccus sp. TaxID=267 RepID=UPI003A8721F4